MAISVLPGSFLSSGNSLALFLKLFNSLPSIRRTGVRSRLHSCQDCGPAPGPVLSGQSLQSLLGSHQVHRLPGIPRDIVLAIKSWVPVSVQNQFHFTPYQLSWPPKVPLPTFRANALHQPCNWGLAKKRQLIKFGSGFVGLPCRAALRLILSYPTDVTLVGLYSRCVTTPLSSPMVSSDSNKWKTLLWRTYLLSENTLSSFPSLSTDVFGRDRREHRVFEQLLDSYPGLLERLQNGSEEEIIHVGELVRCFLRGQNSYWCSIDW
jgi:hypothetical protein